MDEEIRVEAKDGEVTAGVVDAKTPFLADDNKVVANFLGVPEPQGAENRQLKEVWDWAKHKGENEADYLYNIKALENRLGSPALGQSRLNKLHQFIHLDNQVKSFSKLRDEL